MARFAAETAVPSEKSRAEIERTLRRYGADTFMFFEEKDRAAIAFRAHGRHIRFLLPMPDPQDRQFAYTPQRGQLRSPMARREAWEQAIRQSWRALVLVIKAKLEAVEAGISVFEDEFLANIVLPDGRTVGDFIRPQIESAYTSGQMPPLLPWHRDGDG